MQLIDQLSAITAFSTGYTPRRAPWPAWFRDRGLVLKMAPQPTGTPTACRTPTAFSLPPPQPTALPQKLTSLVLRRGHYSALSLEEVCCYADVEIMNKEDVLLGAPPLMDGRVLLATQTVGSRSPTVDQIYWKCLPDTGAVTQLREVVKVML